MLDRFGCQRQAGTEQAIGRREGVSLDLGSDRQVRRIRGPAVVAGDELSRRMKLYEAWRLAARPKAQGTAEHENVERPLVFWRLDQIDGSRLDQVLD
jgi:hypothetical protein